MNDLVVADKGVEWSWLKALVMGQRLLPDYPAGLQSRPR
jgi:hypothetical protein